MATLAAGLSTIQMRLSSGNAIAGTPAQLVALLSENNPVWNEAGADVDFRWESDASSHQLFIDGGNSRVGISSGSLLPTDGLLHIQSATAGSVAAATRADELVIEGSGDIGISFLSSVTANVTILYGRPGDSSRAEFTYDQNDDEFQWSIAAFGGHQVVWSATEAIFNNGSSNYDFRVLGETAGFEHLLFVDASADNVHINNTLNATTAKGQLHIGNGTSPTAVLADGIVLGSKNSSGNTLAVPELWIEDPPEVIGSFMASHKFTVWINGVEYKIQLDAV